MTGWLPGFGSWTARARAVPGARSRRSGAWSGAGPTLNGLAARGAGTPLRLSRRPATSTFWWRRGVIRRQRGVAHPFVAPADPDERPDAGTEPPRRSRRYPSHPIVGVGAVIEQHGRVVLVRRRFEPLAGQWSLPGGTLEVGETLEAGVAREMLEETGLVVAVGPVVEVFDRILLDDQRRVKFHFVLVDYLCRPSGGVLRHGSDVDDAVFVPPSELDKYHLTPKALAIIDRALELAGTRP